jgi:hypothetical protein
MNDIQFNGFMSYAYFYFQLINFIFGGRAKMKLFKVNVKVYRNVVKFERKYEKTSR